MKHSLKEEVIKWLATDKRGQWIDKGIITGLDWKYPDGRTYLPETVGRALRTAETESRIAVKDSGKSVCYKFLPPENRDFYIPWSLRDDKTKLFKL